jgi:hypothetical protein
MASDVVFGHLPGSHGTVTEQRRNRVGEFVAWASTAVPVCRQQTGITWARVVPRR